MEILERHHHSLDIYKEQDRYTPLGADATVVYGYKDLRFRNPYAFPIRFDFRISNSTLIGNVYSTEKILTQSLQFQRLSTHNTLIEVHTFGAEQQLLATSVYQRLDA